MKQEPTVTVHACSTLSFHSGAHNSLLQPCSERNTMLTSPQLCKGKTSAWSTTSSLGRPSSSGWLLLLGDSCQAPPLPGGSQSPLRTPLPASCWVPLLRHAADGPYLYLYHSTPPGLQSPVYSAYRSCCTVNSVRKEVLSFICYSNKQCSSSPVVVGVHCSIVSHFLQPQGEGNGTPLQYSCLENPGRRSLVGCSPWDRKESDTTEQLHFHFSLSCIGEGNGNPPQYSCLGNPRDRGAWWAAVYGVAQSRTRLKWLSSIKEYSSPGSSVHGISQARILEWVSIPFSRGSSQSRDWTWLSCTAGRFLTIWATREDSPVVDVL